MNTLDINIDKKVYKVEHTIPTINLYKIIHPDGFMEISRNRHDGKWKILFKSGPTLRFPLKTIGKAIEKNLTIINCNKNN